MEEIPNGAKLEGIFESVNPPGVCTGWKLELKTSTVPAWKLVAKRKAPEALKPIASPLYTACEAELSTAITAWVGSTLLFQPAIVPFSVANSSALGPDRPPEEMTKPAVPLVVAPVGAAVPTPLGVGIVTTVGDPEGIGCPFESYVVALPEPLSETQRPLFSPSVIPHGLTRFGSVLLAIPGRSETRFVCVNVGEPAVCAGETPGAIARTAEAARRPTSIRPAWRGVRRLTKAPSASIGGPMTISFLSQQRENRSAGRMLRPAARKPSIAAPCAVGPPAARVPKRAPPRSPIVTIIPHVV